MSRYLVAWLLVGVGLAVVQPQGGAAPEAGAIARAERAFARASVERGQRGAFLSFFSETGMQFLPSPVNARASLLAQPPEPSPRPNILDWEPAFVAASRSGTLGYSTGPYEVRENKEGGRILARGWFFSVWKKQADGNWRVEADLGVPDPNAPTPRSQPLATGTLLGHGVTPLTARAREAAGAALKQFEQQVAAQSATDGLAAAYGGLLDAESRLYRPGRSPFIGPDTILSYLKTLPTGAATWTTLFAEVAPTGDLGYAYGHYEPPPSPDGKPRKGSYVRVWKHRADGSWGLAAEVITVQ